MLNWCRPPWKHSTLAIKSISFMPHPSVSSARPLRRGWVSLSRYVDFIPCCWAVYFIGITAELIAVIMSAQDALGVSAVPSCTCLVTIQSTIWVSHCSAVCSHASCITTHATTDDNFLLPRPGAGARGGELCASWNCAFIAIMAPSQWPCPVRMAWSLPMLPFYPCSLTVFL